MKVFSTFSWIGWFELGIIQAFGKENIEIIGYSEVDKFSCAVLAYRFPGVKNYGDIKMIDTNELPDFDVLVGGSPCQDLSISKNNRQGLMGEKSELFFEYVRILRSKKPAFFVLENVASMKSTDKDFISETLGVEPMKINSANFTAQHRNRYYRTNIPNLVVTTSEWTLLQDILENNIDEKYFIDWQARIGKKIELTGEEIPPAILSPTKTDFAFQERKMNKQLFGIDTFKRTKKNVKYTARSSFKSNCLVGCIHAPNLLVVQKEGGYGKESLAVRMPTPIECERLQWFPDDRTLVPRKDRMMSDTQRYKQTGNAVTVNVIQYIFEALKKHLLDTWQALHSSELYSWLVTQKKKRKKLQKHYVAYYKVDKKRWISLEAQKAIVQYFIRQDKVVLEKEFLESNNQNQTTLNQAILFCKNNNAILIVAKLDRLWIDVDHIFSIKKKLNNQLICCDLPNTDRLSISIYVGILRRQRTLHSIKLKSVFKNKKAKWFVFWNTKNLTAAGRKLGIEKIKKNSKENQINQKVAKIIIKCKEANLSYGEIARELNHKWFRTVRDKLFHRNTVKRLFENYKNNLIGKN